MAYSNEELTQRVKQLELIILDLLTQGHRKGIWISGICVNTSLHSRQVTDYDLKDHPPSLEVPHYTYQPHWNWETDFIHLHPDNKPH